MLAHEQEGMAIETAWAQLNLHARHCGRLARFRRFSRIGRYLRFW